MGLGDLFQNLDEQAQSSLEKRVFVKHLQLPVRLDLLISISISIPSTINSKLTSVFPSTDAEMTQPTVKLASIDEDNSLSQHKQQEIKISVASQQVHSKPCPDLLNGPRKDYITTALHVAASAKSTKQVKNFVENMMDYMQNTYLELENNISNTALCLVAVAGNVKMV
ncbi:hypothetical protein L1887_17595 [Cichorium endivia]|nr:hypothetical protein L1887_17595 [Cichorium endivia]